MRILYIAPQPLYQERGSPIAIKMMLEVISQQGHEVDVATYHEGTDFQLDHMRLYRIKSLSFLSNIRPGFSAKKLACDFLLFFVVLNLLRKNRYDVVHAVEEGVFFALLIKVLWRIPYIYDMDSSLVQQMIDTKPKLQPLAPFLRRMEKMVIRQAAAVVPVCDALGDIAKSGQAQKIFMLHDVPLPNDSNSQTDEDLRAQLGIQGLMALYVGNLEPYQGIDLLLDSLALVKQTDPPVDVVVIGGNAADIQKYTEKARSLNIESQVHLLGPRPIAHLASYLAQADILLSPRIKGNNTPMKIYSYLDSGKPVLATDLWTHTQVLDHETSMLTDAEPAAYAAGLKQLVSDENLRKRLGENGKDLIARKHNYTIFCNTLTEMLDWMSAKLVSNKPSHALRHS
ncbi:MAG: glycosyltransferase [Anaerolineae bacterium]|nr:glycosyltransferase [Anaerolineae bacterium]